MEAFITQCAALFQRLGTHKHMVLATALQHQVTARTMSILMMDGAFYFQTDIAFRKYEQIRQNPHVALCTDNIQIEGTCEEMGAPVNHPAFCDAYSRHFPSSYTRYTALPGERLFRVIPAYIQTWIYEDDIPYMEQYDFDNQKYNKIRYTL